MLPSNGSTDTSSWQKREKPSICERFHSLPLRSPFGFSFPRSPKKRIHIPQSNVATNDQLSALLLPNRQQAAWNDPASQPRRILLQRQRPARWSGRLQSLRCRRRLQVCDNVMWPFVLLYNIPNWESAPKLGFPSPTLFKVPTLSRMHAFLRQFNVNS